MGSVLTTANGCMVGMVPEDLSEEGKIVKVKFKFGDNIEEITYNKDFNEDQK